jgi:CRISPR-associated protein Csm1
MSDLSMFKLKSLLVNIGKFSNSVPNTNRWGYDSFTDQFLQEFKSYLGEKIAQEIFDLSAKNPVKISKRDHLIMKIADYLAFSERFSDKSDKVAPQKSLLVALASHIEFREPKLQEMYFNLHRLTGNSEGEGIFSVKENQFDSKAYQQLWNDFGEQLGRLGKYTDNHFTTLLHLIRDFCSFIPAPSPRQSEALEYGSQDISLYIHSKISSAIAICLRSIEEERLSDEYLKRFLTLVTDFKRDFLPDLEDSETDQHSYFILLRGDLSGIQSYLYRITKVEAEGAYRGTAKRLRGRSFYLSLLAEVVADWILREFDLPETNLLFCGGGRFDLLLPNYKGAELNQCDERLQEWLKDKFYGELGVQLAWKEFGIKDFYQWDLINEKVEEKLKEKKRQKFALLFEKHNIFEPKTDVHDVCMFCNITPADQKEAETEKWKNEGCLECRRQRKIGEYLPKTECIAWILSNSPNTNAIKQDRIYEIQFDDPINLTVVLLEDKTDIKTLTENNPKTSARIYRLNPLTSNDSWLFFSSDDNISFGFKFLANEAPIAKQRLSSIQPGKKEDIQKGGVLDFEEMADLSGGAKLLGVLKADVDYLGMLFGLGISPLSISRVAALSDYMDIFFSGWLNQVCCDIAKAWEKESDHPYRGKLKNIFYTIYSGGDDLFVLGPWDGILALAEKIRSEFGRYTCDNPNITLSAGTVTVKPHFPIQRFVDLATEKLETSKNAGINEDKGLNRKDRINVFGETVRWQDDRYGFDQLLDCGKAMAREINSASEKLPRGFVHFLVRLHQEYFKPGIEGMLLWIPKYFYVLKRRVPNRVIGELDMKCKLPLLIKDKKIKIPANYALLKTRKE